MAQNYSQMLADELDPVKRQRMKDQLDKAGLKYTMPTDTNAPVLGPSRADLLKGATTDSQPMQTPQYGTRTPQYTFNELAAQEAGRIAREKEASGVVEPTGNLVEYVDAGGNIQRIRSDQVANVPKDWTLKGTTGTMSVQDALIKARTDAEGSAKERARLLTEAAKARALTEKNTALSKLTEQRGTVEPRFGEARKQAVVGSALATKRLADLIPFSGGMAGAQVKAGEDINTELQQRQSTLDVQKQQELQDIASREQDVQRAYESSVSQAELGALEQANAEIARIGEIYAGRTIDEIARQEGITREEAQLKKTEAEREKQRVEQNYAATINPIEDQTAIIQRLKAQGIPDDDYRIVAHQKVRVAKLGQMADKQYQSEIAKIKDEKERQEQAFETAKWKFEQGMPADSVTATLLGIPVGSVIPSQLIKKAELELDRIRALKSGTTKPKAEKPNVTVSDFEKGIEMQFPEESTAQEESAIAARYIAEGIANGTISVKDAERLAVRYGVTESMIRDYTSQQKFNVMKNL